jgi:hypothetical protein
MVSASSHSMKPRCIARIALVSLAACRHTAPEEMSAKEHLAEAQAHQTAADRERELYTPMEARRLPAVVPRPETPEGWNFNWNPSAQHLERADREMLRAAEHSAAASALKTFEDQACASIEKEQRAACPLFASAVKTVSSTSTGIRLLLTPSASAADIYQRLSCHLAFARANGFDKPSCPLFVKGAQLRRASDNVIEFWSDVPSVAQALQAQAHRIFSSRPFSDEASPTTP